MVRPTVEQNGELSLTLRMGRPHHKIDRHTHTSGLRCRWIDLGLNHPGLVVQCPVVARLLVDQFVFDLGLFAIGRFDQPQRFDEPKLQHAVHQRRDAHIADAVDFGEVLFVGQKRAQQVRCGLRRCVVHVARISESVQTPVAAIPGGVVPARAALDPVPCGLQYLVQRHPPFIGLRCDQLLQVACAPWHGVVEHQKLFAKGRAFNGVRVHGSAQVFNAALKALSEPHLECGHKGMQLPLGAQVRHGQQHPQRFRLKLTVQVQTILKLRFRTLLSGRARQGVNRLFSGLLHHSAPGTQMKARSYRFSPRHQRRRPLVRRLAKVDFSKGRSGQKLKSKRISVRLGMPGPRPVFVVNVYRDGALKELWVSFIGVITNARCPVGCFGKDLLQLHQPKALAIVAPRLTVTRRAHLYFVAGVHTLTVVALGTKAPVLWLAHRHINLVDFDLASTGVKACIRGQV